MRALIDVWDTDTFDQKLMATLVDNRQLIQDYLTTDRLQFEQRDAADRWAPHATNPYAGSYMTFVEAIGCDLMQSRTIRAWHYTRLVDDEVRIVRQNGIYPGTLETLQMRLDALVKAGSIKAVDAAALYAASPCHHPEQQPGRLGKFWMSSDPIATDDGGVELLLGNWGGEATYIWLDDPRLEKLVSGIGRARILELAVPIASTTHGYRAGKAVVAAYARTLGCRPDSSAFDLYSTAPLGPASVLAVHSGGEESFLTMARGYPARFLLDR